MKHYLHQISVLLGIFFLLSSCGKEEPSQPKDVKVTDITISSSTLSMVEGDSKTLTATISPSNATNKKVVWSSSNASVATVAEGKVTAIKEGEATITAKSDDGGKTAECKVSVSALVIPVTGISLDCSSLQMVIGNESVIKATVSPENATNKKVLWSSSNGSVVSVEDGKVKALGEGTATITASSEDGGKTANCSISVSKPTNAYICFTTVNSTETNSLSFKELNSTLLYSYDGIAWANCEPGKEIPFGNGQSLLIHGIDNNSGEGSIGQFVFKEEPKVECSGNIMFLLDCNSEETVIKRAACFEKLFSECKSLVSAPLLPATQLASSCYSSMFNGCTSLTKAPELPATKLAFWCYRSMFEGCSSLTKAPELPATQLAEGCYYFMFWGCASLTKAPDLPATQLADQCYEKMFVWCTSLTSAPDLPATQLASSCYSRMFSSCTSLTKAPELPATQLAQYCYCYMFNGCTSLTKAPELPATQLASGCYNSMFGGCTALTKAPELPATQLAESCYQEMFKGCTSLTKAPELPATQLAQYCYNSMFNGCTSLTKAPELPATQLAERCYLYMFRGCTALTKAPKLSATQLANQCCNSMFLNCTALKEVQDLPATQLAESCYQEMFKGCTSLTKAPELPATQLEKGCYAGMFYGCTSLTKAPDLPATQLEYNCNTYMFYGCTSLNYVKAMFVSNPNYARYMLEGVSPTGTFVKNKAATWENYLVIPNGWTVELSD